MPGGPVNGAYNPIKKEATAIIVPTVLQIAADALSYFTNLTCLYDRYWTADQDKVTLPICMFSVKKITPVYSVESSNKRVLVYEQKEKEDLADGMRNNAMRAIIDNSVRQPTTYNMEAIVPFQPIGRQITDSIKLVSDMITGFSELLGSELFLPVWEGSMATVFAAMKMANASVDSAGKLPGMDSAAYVNMNSLEAMASSCRVLCMKMWTGYQYKYVQITNMVPDKQPTEDDVYRVSMQLKEMPVLSVSPPEVKSGKKSDWAVKIIGTAQAASVAPLIGLTDVKRAAGGGESVASTIKQIWGG